MCRTIFLFLFFFLAGYLDAQEVRHSASDSLRVEALLRQAAMLPADSNRVLFFARSLVGTSYRSATLEHPGKEILTVDFRGMDCTTFVETVLALTQADRMGNGSFHDFADALRHIRYREGVVDGYCSRLHYFTEWAYHNSSAGGLLAEVTGLLGGSHLSVPTDLHYMSTHADAYPPLKGNLANQQKIKEIEERISLLPVFVIRKDREDLLQVLEKIQEGSVIALVTTIDGLDVSHLGFAIRKQGKMHLLHASSLHGKVLEDPLPLDRYLQKQTRTSGIRVLELRQAD